MRRFQKRKVATEFELDLAPLLAVMVKLVPVLLLTTSFVQFSTLNTQLPSSGGTEISDNDKATTMSLKSVDKGFVLTVDKDGRTVETIENADIKEVKLQIKALAVKYPDLKTFFLSPSNANSYEEMTALLEMSPVKEVVLANVFEVTK